MSMRARRGPAPKKSGTHTHVDILEVLRLKVLDARVVLRDLFGHVGGLREELMRSDLLECRRVARS